MFLVNHTRYQSLGDAIISVIHVLAKEDGIAPYQSLALGGLERHRMCTRIYSSAKSR